MRRLTDFHGDGLQLGSAEGAVVAVAGSMALAVPRADKGGELATFVFSCFVKMNVAEIHHRSIRSRAEYNRIVPLGIAEVTGCLGA